MAAASINDKDKNPDEKNVEEEDMPEEIRAAKERLERENPGKVYKYRKARNEMPGIGELLAHGAPEDQGRRKTWTGLLGFPLILVVLFVISMAMFWWVDPITNSKYPRGRFSLANAKRRAMHYDNKAKEAAQQKRDRPSEPVLSSSSSRNNRQRILKKKPKEEDYRSPHDEF